jgi:hypothetical protein
MSCWMDGLKLSFEGGRMKAILYFQIVSFLPPEIQHCALKLDSINACP